MSDLSPICIHNSQDSSPLAEIRRRASIMARLFADPRSPTWSGPFDPEEDFEASAKGIHVSCIDTDMGLHVACRAGNLTFVVRDDRLPRGWFAPVDAQSAFSLLSTLADDWTANLAGACYASRRSNRADFDSDTPREMSNAARRAATLFAAASLVAGDPIPEEYEILIRHPSGPSAGMVTGTDEDYSIWRLDDSSNATVCADLRRVSHLRIVDHKNIDFSAYKWITWSETPSPVEIMRAISSLGADFRPSIETY